MIAKYNQTYKYFYVYLAAHGYTCYAATGKRAIEYAKEYLSPPDTDSD